MGGYPGAPARAADRRRPRTAGRLSRGDSDAGLGDRRIAPGHEILRLEHDFRSAPSLVRFTLRATLVDNATRQVLAWREFDKRVPAAGTPGGGVLAANAAVAAVLDALAEFCRIEAANWQRRAEAPPNPA